MKKKIVVLIISIVGVLAVVVLLRFNHTIGYMSGPENEKISVNGEWYEKDDDSPYGSIDHGFILGKADGPYETTYYVFTVRGDDSYLYVTSMGDGAFYRKCKDHIN